MAASQKQRQTHFVLENWRHVKEERIFMIFLSKDFSEEYKHTELTLSFVQNQNIS